MRLARGPPASRQEAPIDRSTLSLAGAVFATVAIIAAMVSLTASAPEPARGPPVFLTVVSGVFADDRAWSTERYAPLHTMLGLAPCGPLTPPDPSPVELSLADGCTLTSGRGPRCADPTRVRGTIGEWAVDEAGTWPEVPTSTGTADRLVTPRGEGVTLVTDGERWCATPWTAAHTEVALPPNTTAIVDIARTRRARPGGVLLSWRGVERPWPPDADVAPSPPIIE